MSDRDRALPLAGHATSERLRPLDPDEWAHIPNDGPLTDSYGRRIKSLRISVTDKCNFRCVYCMPAEGLPWLGRAEILSYEEITRLVRIAAEIGIEQVRLTGGEPLVRRDVPDLVSMLARIPQLRSVSLTTNGVLLPRLAEPLASAGLTRINV
ncbi:MAG TPA: radical SAM protein, partial [Ktedonobacterales bacterium]